MYFYTTTALAKLLAKRCDYGELALIIYLLVKQNLQILININMLHIKTYGHKKHFLLSIFFSPSRHEMVQSDQRVGCTQLQSAHAEIEFCNFKRLPSFLFPFLLNRMCLSYKKTFLFYSWEVFSAVNVSTYV